MSTHLHRHRPGAGRGPGVAAMAAGTALGCGLLLLAALLSRDLVAAQPVLALAVPGAVAGAVVAARVPELVALAALAVTAAEGSIQAFLDVSSQGFVYLLIGTLLLAAGGRVLFGVRDRPFVLWPGLAVLGLYVVLTFAQIVPADSTELGLRAFADSAYYLLAGLVLALTLTREESRKRLTRGIILLSFLVGAYATFRWIVGPAAKELAVARSSGASIEVSGQPALVGSFSERGALARWAAQSIPLCLACGLLSPGRWRLVAFLACPLLAVGLLGSGTRVAAVAVTVAVLVVLLLYQFARAAPGAKLGVTVTAAVLLVAMGVGAWTLTIADRSGEESRYSAIFDPARDATYSARLERWDDSVRIMEQNPLGTGLGTAGRVTSFAQFATPGGGSTDNAYLQVGIEQGIVCLVLLVAGLIGVAVGLARRGVRTHDAGQAALAIGACGALAGVLVLMYTGLNFSGLPVLLLWVIVGLAASSFVNEADYGQPNS